MEETAIIGKLAKDLVGVPAPHEYVTLWGTAIALSRIGHGYPVVCLHATGHGGSDFLPLARHPLCHDLAFTLIDWPGQGLSPSDATHAPASAERYAEILLDLLASMADGPPPFLLGNSIGAAAAIIAAGRSERPVAGLILCDPAGLAVLGPFERFGIRAMVSFFHAGARGAWWYPRAFALYYRLVLPRAPERGREIAALAREHAPVLSEAWKSFGEKRADIRHLLTRTGAPMFFAWAKSDWIVPYAASAKAVSSTTASVRLFRGGHAPFLEDLNNFAGAFSAFVKSAMPGSQTAMPR